MKRKIAVYNNSTGVVELMKALFLGEGLDMVNVPTVEELLQLIERDNIQLIILDIELDGNDLGHEIEIIKRIRRRTVIPMMVISSQTAETAKIMSLNVGVDDYVTLNESPLVILARVKAQLSRYTELTVKDDCNDHIYRIGELELDDKRHIVMEGGNNVNMTPIEYKILRLLIQQSGKVFSKKQIYEKIWKTQALNVDNVVTVHISHIRDKIERNPKKPQYIKVVRGLGYRVG